MTKSKKMKNLFDICFGILLWFMLSPLFIFIIIFIRVNIGQPIFFKQPRPGLNGNIFELIKFRTMTNARDENGNLLSDEKRMTNFGRFLRSFSLDELPELYNVLKGEMSLVGPRPLLLEYLDRYTPHQRKRHNVRPGITGWAQINGRNAISWEQKFDLDVWYVKNYTFILDLQILLKTLRKIFNREGISQPGHATTERFHPSENDCHTCSQ
jgi:sugar transferase EpsL